MPNINYINGQVVDPAAKRVDSLIFKVPVDDDRHLHFEVRMMPYSGEQGRQWLERRRAQRAKDAIDRLDLVRAVLDGRLRLDDIDPNRTDHVLIEDEVAQTGQGAIANRTGNIWGEVTSGSCCSENFGSESFAPWPMADR